jgi:beta-lactamase superfamily II metal-dependent hydrolase
MKLIVFDVGNAACSVISSPTNIGMMIDCGSHGDKTNPVDLFKSNKEWLGTVPFEKSTGAKYELGLLHITHPDDDHVRNAKRIAEELPPYLLRRRRHEEFPDNESINQEYKDNIDEQYRGSNPETIEWGFDKNQIFQIPMSTIKEDENLAKKIRNNSSILRFIEYNGVRILYSGDMESPGWDWLVEHNSSFVETVKGGIDILIAPHHGHKSGFPTSLFELIGNVKCVIHSKGSEGNIEGTDVSTQYSDKSDGVSYKNLNDKCMYKGKVLTTRSNGNIYIQVNTSDFNIWCAKASSNHEKIS